MKIEHFVFDTNTLVSALLFTNSVPTKAYEKAKRLGWLCASASTYNEFCEVFERAKFDRYASSITRLATISQLKEVLTFCEVTESISVCHDPKDNMFLELAVAANAACIISGDNDLLVLHPFRNIPILNAFDFLNNF